VDKSAVVLAAWIQPSAELVLRHGQIVVGGFTVVLAAVIDVAAQLLQRGLYVRLVRDRVVPIRCTHWRSPLGPAPRRGIIARALGTRDPTRPRTLHQLQNERIETVFPSPRPGGPGCAPLSALSSTWQNRMSASRDSASVTWRCSGTRGDLSDIGRGPRLWPGTSMVIDGCRWSLLVVSLRPAHGLILKSRVVSPLRCRGRNSVSALLPMLGVGTSPPAAARALVIDRDRRLRRSDRPSPWPGAAVGWPPGGRMSLPSRPRHHRR